MIDTNHDQSNIFNSARIGDLHERNKLLRVTGEEWVVGQVVHCAVGDCEGEGFNL
jgi:hypothetical protein